MSISNYIDSLGLSSDPFKAKSNSLWSGLEEFAHRIQHTVEFSAHFVVIYGGRGTGKSELALYLYRRLADSNSPLLYSARADGTFLGVLSSFHDHLALPALPSQNTDGLSLQVEESLKLSSSETVVVLVDDANFLSCESIYFLASLACRGNIGLILFSEANLNDLCPASLFSSAEVFELPEPALEDIIEALHCRLRGVGYSGQGILGDAEAEQLWRASDGSIQKFLENAEKWLQAKYVESPERSLPLKVNSHGLPVIHIIAISALLATLGVTCLYSGENAGVQEGGDLSVQPKEPSHESSVSVEILASSSQAPASSSLAVTSPAHSDVGSGEASSFASSSLRIHTQDVVPEVELEAQAAAVRPKASVWTEDELEVMSWPPDEYTIQVLGVASYESADRFILAQSNASLLKLVRSKRQGKQWFIVLAGRYQSLAEARNRLGSLPQSQAKAGAWPRTVSEVQELISAYP